MSRRNRHVVGLWPVIAAVAVVTGVWMVLAGLRLDWRNALLPAFAVLGLEGTAAFYTYRRPEVRFAATLSGLAQLIAFSAVAVCLSYAAASTAGPFWDESLVSWDRALGFDWRAYLAFVDATPWLGLFLTIAYQSLQVQLALVMVVLGFSGRVRDIRTFLFAYVIAGLATVITSALMPAMAMYALFKLQPADFPHLAPAAAYVHVAAMDGLRAGTLRLVSVTQGEGIITFPSFHAVLGVLITMALWPVYWLRWPVLVLNVLLVAAAPIDGGHYLIDILAGSGLAVLANRLAGYLATDTVRGAILKLADAR